MSTGLIIVADPECNNGLDAKAIRHCLENMSIIDQWYEGQDLPYANNLLFECKFTCNDQSARITAHQQPVIFLSLERSSECSLQAALEIQKHYDHGELFVIIGDDQSSATSLKSVSTVNELRKRLNV